MLQRIYLIKSTLAFTAAVLMIFSMVKSVKGIGSDMNVYFQDEPYRTETFEIELPGDLDVQTSGGFITVDGSTDNSVRVEMYVQKNGKYLLPDEEELEDWEVDISQTGQTIRVHAKKKGKKLSLFNRKNTAVSFIIYTPRDMSTVLKTSGGHIATKGLSGEQQISTSGGHLELADLKGTVEAKTSGGHIDLDNVQGEMDVKTSGGHIDVNDAEGSLSFKTSGGQLELSNIRGRLQASTSGGSISAELLSVEEFADLRTSGGNVSITVPEEAGFSLDLKGSLVRSDLIDFSGKADRDEIRGEIYGGGPAISAKTSGGIVSLSFK